jgi:peptide/nickel transport system substrate-binding protein
MRLKLERYSIIDKLMGLIETRKTSDRLILRVLFFITVFSGVFFLYNLNGNYSLPTPTRGGVINEGIVGIPRFVNPALAITRADLDAVAILYSGLLKIDPDGNLVPDLASNIAVSEDGKTYTIDVKRNRTFHDDTPITARDVVYTIKLVQDPDLKSPLRGNWNDVTIEEVDEYQFKVILTEAYAPFMENFTLGIMPHHIWSTLPIEQLPFSQRNTEPVGSGPFKIASVNRDTSGLISSYSLIPALNQETNPNLSGIQLRFFQNEAALEIAFNKGEINSTAYLPTEVVAGLDMNNLRVVSEPLPRIFGLFFNQNRSASLRDKSARQALDAAIDRDALVGEILNGYGVPTTKPILEALTNIKSTSTESISDNVSPIENAKNILVDGGWKQNSEGLWEKKIGEETETLSLTIKTSNLSLFDKTTTLVANNWRDLGVEVQVEQYEQTGLVQSVIRTRDFQVLLFGLDMNRTQDLYPFWHSSQKDDPGLNISQYTNIAVDRILEKTKNTQDKNERLLLMEEVTNTISEEVPAIFLFAPSITYVLDEDIITAPIKSLGRTSDRFMNVSDWYAKTETVWPIFRKDDTPNNIN